MRLTAGGAGGRKEKNGGRLTMRLTVARRTLLMSAKSSVSMPTSKVAYAEGQQDADQIGKICVYPSQSPVKRVFVRCVGLETGERNNKLTIEAGVARAGMATVDQAQGSRRRGGWSKTRLTVARRASFPETSVKGQYQRSRAKSLLQKGK